MSLKSSFALLLILISGATAEAAPHFCASVMLEDSRRLLEFHLEQAQEFEELGPVVERDPMSLGDGLRRDSVLETMAEVGKMGTYIIRMTTPS